MGERRWLSHWFSPRNHRGPGSPCHRAFTQSRSTTAYTLIATDIESVRAIAMVSIRSVRRRLRCRTKPAGDPHTVLCHHLPRRCRLNGWMCQTLHRRTDHLGYHSCSTARDRYPGTANLIPVGIKAAHEHGAARGGWGSQRRRNGTICQRKRYAQDPDQG